MMPIRRFPKYDTILRIARLGNVSLSTCEIAHAKEILGFPVRRAHNRINPNHRTQTCSRDKLQVIRRIVRDLSRSPAHNSV